MFVHAFLVVEPRGQVLYVSRAKRRAYVVCAWCAHVVSRPAGQRSTAIMRSHGARVRACVCARFLPRSLRTTVVRVTRKALRVSRLLVRRIRDARAHGA